MTVVAIGKRYTKANPSRIGGVIMLFEDFVSQLEKCGIEHRVIDLNFRNYRGNLIGGFLCVSYQLLREIGSASHVTMHGTANEFIYVAPILVLLCRVLGKAVSLRKFAGNFHEVLSKLGFVRRAMVEYALSNATICFFETRYLVEHFRSTTAAISWFPNVRPPIANRTSAEFTRRFLFVGHITPEKGIDLIISTARTLPHGYTIDLVGPMAPNSPYAGLDFQDPTLRYDGTLAPTEVRERMSEYDCLILPSFREGYPGVIIEAFSVGLPVIASDLPGIRELAGENDAATLIPPGDEWRLVDAVRSMTHESYLVQRNNALRRFEEFNSDLVTARVIGEMLSNKNLTRDE